jgi:hypothetical protein
MQQKTTTPAPKRIGDYVISPSHFTSLDTVFNQFNTQEFKSKAPRKRFQQVNEQLLKLIQDSPKQSFLLAAVIEYVDRVNRAKILNEPYHLSLFEFWLNHFSNLNDAENYEVRGKIVGKYIPREDYQAFFPIGMDKTFSGTHFIAAHLSPDVDTMVASFWGFIDAFAARVGNAQHLWSLPGGPPDAPMKHTFADFFGSSIFQNAAHISGSLVLRALDLVTQKGFVKKKGETSISALDPSSERAVILVDDKGHFIGDWHSADVDPIRKIVIRFKSCLRWFENNLHVKLISLFTKKKLHVDDLKPFLSSVFDVPISDCEPVKEFTERQRKDLHDFFSKVLNLKKGLQSTFSELDQGLTVLGVLELSQFQAELEALRSSDLFDANGFLKEDRPLIFNHIEKLIHHLDNSIHRIRDYAEQLDVAMSIKSKVLGIPPQYATMRNDVEDMRIKIRKAEYLTVVIEEDDKLFPIGVVWSSDLNKTTLGTVTFRDFCNQEEVRMPAYLSPISVVDHHKTSLKTSSAPMALVGDAQSCNVLVGEQAFNINARYSLGSMNPESIDKQIELLRHSEPSLTSMRILQRLMRRHVAAKTKGQYFIHPERELTEYLSFLHAILDDTDLLTKVSKRDIECVVELLNRLKSLIANEEVEVINLDDIPLDKRFCKAAAKRILQNEDMYSIYRQVFVRREMEVEKSLELLSDEDYASLFLDTKEQNGCCRVGQSKLFSVNFPKFFKQAPKLMEFWLKKAQEVNKEHPEIDLHLHMISTISSANEVYEDNAGRYDHQDELWFWIPNTQRAYDHLSSFLTGFQAANKFGENANLEFLDGVSDEVYQIFARDFAGVQQKKKLAEGRLPIVILRYGAGTLNSRKAMVSPYLPRYIP